MVINSKKKVSPAQGYPGRSTNLPRVQYDNQRMPGVASMFGFIHEMQNFHLMF